MNAAAALLDMLHQRAQRTELAVAAVVLHGAAVHLGVMYRAAYVGGERVKRAERPKAQGMLIHCAIERSCRGAGGHDEELLV